MDAHSSQYSLSTKDNGNSSYADSKYIQQFTLVANFIL